MSDGGKELLLDEVRRYYRATPRRPAGLRALAGGGAGAELDDLVALVDAALDMRIAARGSCRKFESAFARTTGVRKALLTSSGRSANLLAVAALTSPRLGERRLVPGDEVITLASGSPGLVNPVVHCGLVPVLVDVELATYNTTVELVEAAIGPRTRAVIVPHVLGNPCAVAEVAETARRHGLFLIEDNRQAVGASYRGRVTGSFGHLATASFGMGRQLVMGLGGCVLTSDLTLARVVESLRDWGRDCWCAPGEDNRCRRRFGYTLGTLPPGYDHKYIFSHVGYNLKATDLQAALGLSQLERLVGQTVARRGGWTRLRDGLADVPGVLLPTATEDSEPSWSGFAVTVLPGAPFTRNELQGIFASQRIATASPAGLAARRLARAHRPFRIAGTVANSAVAARRSFWVDVHAQLDLSAVDRATAAIREFAGTAALRRASAANAQVTSSPVSAASRASSTCQARARAALDPPESAQISSRPAPG